MQGLSRSTPFKDADIAICHSRGYSFANAMVILQDPERDWRGGIPGVHTYKRKCSLGKRHIFLIEKLVMDIIWGRNLAPDLLESIMKPSGLAKLELRRSLIKISYSNLVPKSKISGLPLFGCLEKSQISAIGCLQEQSSLFFKQS